MKKNFVKYIDYDYLNQYFTGDISLFRYYQNKFIENNSSNFGNNIRFCKFKS